MLAHTEIGLMWQLAFQIQAIEFVSHLKMKMKTTVYDSFQFYQVFTKFGKRCEVMSLSEV